MEDTNKNYTDEDVKNIIKTYIFDNYHNVDLNKKEAVLKYIYKAINRQIDDNSIDLIIKSFITSKASINDFNDDKLTKVLVIIYNYVDSNFSVKTAVQLNNIAADYRPQIDFSGMRYEDFDPMFDDFNEKCVDNISKENHGWVRGCLPVDTKKERF